AIQIHRQIDVCIRGGRWTRILARSHDSSRGGSREEDFLKLDEARAVKNEETNPFDIIQGFVSCETWENFIDDGRGGDGT
ncbi:unnamed protein product, partial [Didymodactylos carnosus]